MTQKVTPEIWRAVIGLHGQMIAREIAAKFGLSRATVKRIWRADRQGAIAPRPLSENMRFQRSALTGLMVKHRRTVPSAMLSHDEPLTMAGVTFADLASSHCRWIIGADFDNELRYCGHERMRAPPKGHASYCLAHTCRALHRPDAVAHNSQPSGPSAPRKAGAFDFVEAPPLTPDLVKEFGPHKRSDNRTFMDWNNRSDGWLAKQRQFQPPREVKPTWAA